jgi:glycosyltransferase involved in cell wall biosynthesis
MKTFGISMVKDEEDIIGPVVQHMLTQVDHVLIADNMSTDRTRSILDSFDNSYITVVDDLDPAYYQSKKMTALAHQAGGMGADFIVPFDADEIWYSPFGLIKDVLASVPQDWFIVSALLYDHVPTSMDDLNEENLVKRIGWRRKEASVLQRLPVDFMRISLLNKATIVQHIISGRQLLMVN